MADPETTPLERDMEAVRYVLKRAAIWVLIAYDNPDANMVQDAFDALARIGALAQPDPEVERLKAEIERLRQRLSKIAHAPVPESNTTAMLLKEWAMPRDGETNG